MEAREEGLSLTVNFSVVVLVTNDYMERNISPFKIMRTEICFKSDKIRNNTAQLKALTGVIIIKHGLQCGWRIISISFKKRQARMRGNNSS